MRRKGWFNMTFIKNGTAASPGYAIAHAFRLETIDLSFERLEEMNPTVEISRLDQSLQKALEEIKLLQDHASERLGDDKAEIFGAHFLLLQDPEYINAVKDLIKQKKINAETAFAEVSQSFIAMFDTMDNEYMKDRAADIRDVSNRVLTHLLGKQSHSLGLIQEPVIIIAHDLTPSDTAQLDPHFVKGFATNIGGRTSHSAIMARSLEIPAVVGLKDITESVQHGDKIIINGNEGTVIVSPSSVDVSTYEQKIEEYELEKNELRGLIDSASITLDGHTVELVANIGIPEDAINALQYGTEGVGLFRTEFLYMGREDFPTEEEQYSSYKKVTETMGDRPVIIRTLDIGGDKELSYLKLPKEMNPFLGIRAIRLCLDRKDLFKTQLRAILRASKHGNIKIMYPMIATREELFQANAVLDEVKQELLEDNIPFNDSIEVGIMVEIPAAALISDILAKHVDFFSIGTNDLIQYTMAADRMNEGVSYLYQPYHPAILRLVRMVIEAGHAEGKWVGMCGELAGDITAVPILLGLGLDEFSMSAPSILPVRQFIRSLRYDEMKEIAHKALTMGNQDEVKAFVEESIRRITRK